MNVDHDQVTENNGPAPAPDGAPAAEAAPPDNVEALREQLAEATQKADEYLRLAQRSQADLINFRRRIEDERAQQARDATISYILRLLPVLDDFERALANAAPEDLESNWGKGLLLVERNLRSLLASDDIQRISAEGTEFDPREHEALGRQPSTDVADGHVLHVVRQGYKKGERVIRPAQVIIAAPPESSPKG
jgi:molecular chaperone GrpE